MTNVTDHYMVLSNSLIVPAWLYQLVYERVHAFRPHMLLGHHYTLETICGNETWQTLEGRVTKGLAGRIMVYLVDKGDLGIVFADINKNPIRYRLSD